MAEEEARPSKVIGPKTLHADEQHEHVLLSGHYNSRWFGQNHALIGKDGVSLHAVDSRDQSILSLYLSEAEMNALVEAWQRYGRHQQMKPEE